jgi:NADPH-ferrihemoprotein reductase
MTLFFGCRKREEDYIYAEEIMDQNSCGTYCAVFEAFSREDVVNNLMQPKVKVYVQDILEHKEDMIKRVLYQSNGAVYICGSTAMSKDVLKVITKHVANIKNLSFSDAEQEMDRLLLEKKICMEAWN